MSAMQSSIRRLAIVLAACFVVIALGLTYWQVIRAQELVYSDYNPRLAKEDAQILRGSILDRDGRKLVYSESTPNGIERHYTDPTTAQVTGYYSARYGTAGLENTFDRYLRGDVQTNAFDAAASDLLHRPRVGANLTTTLDSKLQAAAVQAMGSNKGAAVAIDPHTGAIRAMVSIPYYDPNKLDQDWKTLASDPNTPLLNRATQGLYVPGSVFKIVTATAAIDLGLVDLNKHYNCANDLVVDGFRIVNKNHPPGVTYVTYVDDFAYSNNVTFAKTALSLGGKSIAVGDDIPNPPPWDVSIDQSRQRFEEYTRRFGFDRPLPFDIPTSTSTIGNQNLSRVELANLGFGQGRIEVTPLLMALGAATIANGGEMPAPYLVQEIRDPSGTLLMQHTPQTIRQVMSPETAKSMNRLMTTSVQEGYAKPAQISGVEVGGKTGSAEVGGGKTEHSWFIGYAPANNPVIAVAVIMENKGPGDEFATPAGRQIMEAALGR